MPVPAIAMGIGAAASLFGAHKQASAAKDAAKTQAQSADRALALNERVYNDQMRMTAPYVQFGTQSLGNLGRLSATPFSEQTNGYVSAAQGGGTPRFQQGMTNPAAGIPLNQPTQGPGAYTGNGGQGVALGQQGGGMVRMRAPDGSVRPVPAQLVDKYRQRGGQVMQ